MDAKRIIPVLEVCDGRILAAESAHPAEWAVRLEREGADGIIFRETAPVGLGPLAVPRAGWVRDVAGALSLPFALEAAFRGLEDLEEVLEAGADRVLLRPAMISDPTLAGAAREFGRARLGVALTAELAPGAGWRMALAGGPEGRDAQGWMAEMEQWGASEILLEAGPEGAATGTLFQGAARLALSVLFHGSGEPGRVADALLNGADGVAFPAGTRSPEQWKSLLRPYGLTLRD
jgi:imidazole glycerol phosphate synthase subunit HisF